MTIRNESIGSLAGYAGRTILSEHMQNAQQAQNYAQPYISPGRLVLTDQQMAERGLFYDALRGGVVKLEPPPIGPYKHEIRGNRPGLMILDDLQADEPTKKVKKDYNTVGVRFLRGNNLHKVYTYKVPKRYRGHLGQELVVPTPWGNSTAIVVELHKTPRDDEGYKYKFAIGTVKPL